MSSTHLVPFRSWVNPLRGLLVLLLLTGSGAALSPAHAQENTPASSYEQGYRFESNGWIYLHIEGDAYDRGFQHGYLLAPEIEQILTNTKALTYWNTGMEWDFFVEHAVEMFVPWADEELLQEIKGIAAGAKDAGVDVTWEDILTWNGYEELTGYWWPNEEAGKYAQADQDHCSAFIATGSMTKDGGVVMAHNSWDTFTDGQNMNVILDIAPTEGNRIIMQSVPGYIDSMTDFFVTSAGIMGTETTIGGYSDYAPNEAPEFFRVRKAMQYAQTLDDFVEIMQKENDGGYANSWLLADTNSGEIMRFELGLKYQSVTRTMDGYYIGFNAPYDPRIRNLECSGDGFFDIRTAMGARRVRLTQLMEEYSGQIDAEVAQAILSDHYDVYLNEEKPGSRTVEGHYELDAFEYWPARLPYAPQGAVDGKVATSALAKEMSFWARWGSSSGMPFVASEYLAEHIQWDHLAPYLKDRPTQPWTQFTAGEEPAAEESAMIDEAAAGALTEADNGDTVSLAVGETIQVTLESNPTTGYEWLYQSGDPDVIKQVGDAVYNEPDSGLMGAGGSETFTFEATGAGETVLELWYMRPWESVQPDTTFEVTVVVE
jgi:predicted secreted protein